MVTNEERREVARKLRGLTCVPLVEKELGLEYDESMPNSWLWFTRKSVDRLAALIEPDTTSDTTKPTEPTTKCDRDALFELAEEMEAAAARYENRPAYIDDCADRIREALGVPDECQDAASQPGRP